MEFSDTTNKDGIIQMIEQTTNLGDGTITTGNTVQLAYFTNLINQWYRIVAYYAWRSDKMWTFDDRNQTDFPIATTTVVNNQRDYSFASTDLRIRQVEIMSINGYYSTLEYMPNNSGVLYTQKQQENAGLPTHFRLNGNSLILYPKPDTTVVTAAEGLRITTDREVSAFVVGDTTKEPGFGEQFHPILYYGPCLEWATIKQNEGVEKICREMLGGFEGLTEQVKLYFGEKNQATVPLLKRSYSSYK